MLSRASEISIIIQRQLSPREVANKYFVIIGGVATQKNRTLPQISNLGLVFFDFFWFFFGSFRFFSVFPFWPILTGLTGSC